MKKRKTPLFIRDKKVPDYFCDRVAETEKLCSSLYNGRNVTLISPRKIILREGCFRSVA